jgi:hypothetical protein
MKTLTLLLLSFTLPSSKVATRPPAPTDLPTARHARPGGTWYMAENGHAVFCYGPVMLLRQPNGNFQRVATFCRGGQAMVPLKD